MARDVTARRSGMQGPSGPRQSGTWTIAMVVVLVVVGSLSSTAVARAADLPQRAADVAPDAHLITAGSATLAVPAARIVVGRATTGSLRRDAEGVLLLVLAVVVAAAALIAWRRGYVAGRHERITASPGCRGKIYLVRGPPSGPSRYPTAVAAGDRLMHLTREDWRHAIRNRLACAPGPFCAPGRGCAAY